MLLITWVIICWWLFPTHEEAEWAQAHLNLFSMFNTLILLHIKQGGRFYLYFTGEETKGFSSNCIEMVQSSRKQLPFAFGET